MPSADPSPSSPAPSRKSDSGADGPAAGGASGPKASSEPSDEARESPAGVKAGDSPAPLTTEALLPAAWQPITFRGVAAFAGAKLGRLLLVQLIVALLTAGAVGWFLSIH